MTDRPDTLKGITAKKKCNCGSIYLTLNSNDKGELVEVITSLGKGGTCGKSVNEGYGRLISRLLWRGEKPSWIVKTLKGINCKGATDETPSCMTRIALTIDEETSKVK